MEGVSLVQTEIWNVKIFCWIFYLHFSVNHKLTINAVSKCKHQWKNVRSKPYSKCSRVWPTWTVRKQGLFKLRSLLFLIFLLSCLVSVGMKKCCLYNITKLIKIICRHNTAYYWNLSVFWRNLQHVHIAGCFKSIFEVFWRHICMLIFMFQTLFWQNSQSLMCCLCNTDNPRDRYEQKIKTNLLKILF